jgi:hypothetical protein
MTVAVFTATRSPGPVHHSAGRHCGVLARIASKVHRAIQVVAQPGDLLLIEFVAPEKLSRGEACATGG